jgi:hypothetical protein
MVSHPYGNIHDSNSEALILHPAYTRLNRLRKKFFGCHSERSEESLFGFCFEPGGILRFAQNDGIRIFPQAVKERAAISTVVLKSLWKRTIGDFLPHAKQRV